MKVSALPSHERPAFRAKNIGIHALSNVELVTLALGLPDTAMAESMLMQAEGSLRRLAETVDAIEVKGIGETKKLSVAAMVELARRGSAEAVIENPAVRSPRDVAELMAPRIQHLRHEELHVLLLDAQHRVERFVLVTRGILNSSLAHPREVFKPAILASAAAIIVVHNHPSGELAPSAEDRHVTDQLVAAGRMLDIPVHDHVIIGRGGKWFSFAEAGLL